MVRKAVIPIAGYGLRCLPFSKAIPKTMINVITTPVIQLIVDELVQSGVKEILFVEGSSGYIVQNHFSRNVELENFLIEKDLQPTLANVRDIHTQANFYFMQPKEITGSGSSILAAKNWVGNEPFLILCGDEFFTGKIPVVKQLIDVYEKTGKSVIATKVITDDERENFGVLEGKLNGKILEITRTVEKPKKHETDSNYAGMGRYLLTPDIFEYLENTKPSAGNEIQLTDAMQTKNLEKHDIVGYVYDGKRYDCGNKFGYMVASIEAAIKDKDIAVQIKEYLSKLHSKDYVIDEN